MLASNQQSEKTFSPLSKITFIKKKQGVNIFTFAYQMTLKSSSSEIFLPLFDIQKSFHGPSSLSNFGYNIALREQMNEACGLSYL